MGRGHHSVLVCGEAFGAGVAEAASGQRVPRGHNWRCVLVHVRPRQAVEVSCLKCSWRDRGRDLGLVRVVRDAFLAGDAQQRGLVKRSRWARVRAPQPSLSFVLSLTGCLVLLRLLLLLLLHVLCRSLTLLLGLPWGLPSQRTVIITIVYLPAVPDTSPAGESISKRRRLGTMIRHQEAAVICTWEELHLIVHGLHERDVRLWRSGGQRFGASALWTAAHG